MGSDVSTVGQVENLPREVCFAAALAVADLAHLHGLADEGDVEELLEMLEMLGLVQPRQPPPAGRRRWGGQP